MKPSNPEGPANAPDARGLPWGWATAAVAAYGVSILLVNPGRPWALTFHEVNFAGPAREFLRSGDWLVPRIMGRPLWDKPPLMHWSIAASMAAFGTEAEWAARMPAALSAVATSLVVAALAARWFGGRVGLLAGLVQSSSIYVFMQGRLAEADMMLCAAVSAAMASFAVGVVGRDRPARSWTLLYFGAAGLSFLVKGPIGPALVAAGGGLFAIVERRWAPWRLLLDPIGWGVMLALILAWPAAAMLREPGLLDVWWRHNVERFSGDLAGGGKDPFFYLYTSLWLTLPWTPVAAAGIASAWRSGEGRGGRGRLLACWSLGMALVLSLSAWKHKHYIIPALPPLSIWAAIGLSRLVSAEQGGRWSRLRSRLRPTLPILALAGFSAGLAGMRSGSRLVLAVGAVAGLVGLGLTIAERWRRAGRPGVATAGIFATAWAAFVAVHSLAMPGFDDYRGQSDLALRLSASLPAGADLSVVAIPDPQVTYYLPIPVRRHDDPRSLADRLAASTGVERRGPVYVVGPRLILGPLGRMGEIRVIDQAASVHPRKGERDRMIAVELRPDPDRLAAVVSGRRPVTTARR
ncbi:ArnT family glycosyltransferase [Tautonia plasticadhaerens]|uniref:Undecaprenyl phosphate-alpha-4-amino-4-deoxy-L-arabinose arabinosyl transferase n=1 Tax=Tautonia plasticadhaerens TaxID=2527974 RepID=A0A518HCW0_9BACT|nr:glycosyltransferase family 39 protein [Tautonia plasticadhaerens]QDV38699.1 Undecaprenyl phosphate-alpha-4-amino-4-deoxy-L-arabinose arabinosyl transferase [Tautonia plasticadhaerens]